MQSFIHSLIHLHLHLHAHLHLHLRFRVHTCSESYIHVMRWNEAVLQSTLVSQLCRNVYMRTHTHTHAHVRVRYELEVFRLCTHTHTHTHTHTDARAHVMRSWASPQPI